MGLRINTNIQALAAQRHLATNGEMQHASLDKLSSGSRINKAGDDAAGLAISEKLEAQIRGTQQASRNGQDGISMIQTAEGALIETTSMLQRMRELGVLAQNDTYSSSQRTAMEDEFTALRTEIDRIGKDTQWNNFNLLDATGGNMGGASTYSFQVGANSNQTITVKIAATVVTRFRHRLVVVSLTTY